MVTDVLDVAFVVPSSGPSGIYGPSCWASGRLAVSEINDGGGILGREVRLRPVDGGRRPQEVADEVGSLVSTGAVGAVAGWHTSAVRQAVVPRLEGRVAYVYTALYEGGERTPGVFLTGETPAGQLLPALGWMARELGIRSWCIVGNDYIWPRASARVARAFAESVGVEIRDEVYVGLGTEEFGPTLRRVERSHAQGVLMLLLGSDAVQFNRAFTEMRLHDHCVRLSPLMDENMLLATGAANTHELYSAAGFFEALGTSHGLDFERRYLERLGPTAPAITSPGESCFEGMTLLSHLAAAARSTDVASINAAAESVTYEGPRGAVRVRDRHLLQRIYLARADGLEFDVLAEIDGGA
ncbi:substrate-binding domain-containing protein [Pseudonocardia sp. KRD-184]|uniref:Substrate-binding domain-containing protein n=1 Tax=Pseudonocardia oceani TaxID=2792013 RepID=A0ABS6UHJ3_9PSEU|nr:substrate-binding domain-containing protein [Pseudonocardia oceani]MBW0090297.1 substrate-binding domain-containing protein [Pseudonocardia oceani]MBW0098473.1 substrate-binding domain-containing protein [Pseudonocardia oceani]MBW0109922.1 substrate-binding domain-containing protein [Pseudonocardia oceani]MBW0120365.1 substrate-binding domain-containing protein [Pseudonocardia oceani]MBW0131381.1 substrate-binding domain-containing protein [Pseudonocardia oceani]